MTQNKVPYDNVMKLEITRRNSSFSPDMNRDPTIFQGALTAAILPPVAEFATRLSDSAA